MTTTTWADGFGTWHARVQAGPDAPRMARLAIRSELYARGNEGPLRLALRQVPDLATDNTIVYREA